MFSVHVINSITQTRGVGSVGKGRKGAKTPLIVKQSLKRIFWPNKIYSNRQLVLGVLTVVTVSHSHFSYNKIIAFNINISTFHVAFGSTNR